MKILPRKWDNADKYEQSAEKFVSKRTIWNEKQNTPDLVVDDIMVFTNDFFICVGKDRDEFRQFLYATLLKRGVNKWLFVRKLLIRLKKLYCQKVRDSSALVAELKKDPGNPAYHYEKGKLAAYNEIRGELLALCRTPRWVIWNWHAVGIIDTEGTKSEGRWKKVYNMLINTKFKQ